MTGRINEFFGLTFKTMLCEMVEFACPFLILTSNEVRRYCSAELSAIIQFLRKQNGQHIGNLSHPKIKGLELSNASKES